MGLGDALTYVTEGEVQYQGKRATIKINHETCVGVGMCVVCCPVDIFESSSRSYLVKENLHKCLLHACMKCRDNCPTGSVLIRFEESF
jgi:ferredoxin